MNKDELLMQINTNLPDNNKQSITAKKLRDSLYGIVDYTDEMDAELAKAIEENTPEPEFIEYEDLMAKAERGELEVGKEYRFPYTLITQYETSEDNPGYWFKSAGHYFDIVTRAITPNILSEQVRCMYNENDSYFKDNNAPVAAWQVWINMQRKREWPEGVTDTEHTKGWIYRFIDNNNIECNYDFKNMMTKMVCISQNDDFESDWKNCISVALYGGADESKITFFAYTFSYPGVWSDNIQDWINNIKDASLFIDVDGYKLIQDVKINLAYTDEISGCVFKFLAYFDGEMVYYINSAIYNISIINNTGTTLIFDASFDNISNVTLNDCSGYINHSDTIKLTNSCNFYIYNCYYINAENCGDLILKNCNNCNIIESNNISAVNTNYTNINKSTFIEPNENWYNIIFGDEIEEYGLSYVDNCNIYSAKYVKRITSGSNSNFNFESLTLQNIKELIFNSFNHIEFNSGLTMTNNNYRRIDEFTFSEMYNTKIGNGNAFIINDDSDLITDLNYVTVGNENEIEISRELESGDIMSDGFKFLNSVTIGDNNTELFIKNSDRVKIGNNNSQIQIYSNSAENFKNIVIGNSNSVFITNIVSNATKNCYINNIVIGNGNAFALGSTTSGKINNNNNIYINNIYIGNSNNIYINNANVIRDLQYLDSLHFYDNNTISFSIGCKEISNCIFSNYEIDDITGADNTMISNLNCNHGYIPGIVTTETDWNNQYYIYINGDFENNVDLSYIKDNYLDETHRILHISGDQVYAAPLLGPSFE